MTVPTITQYIISNILLRFPRMFSKFTERAQLCNICKNMRILFNIARYRPVACRPFQRVLRTFSKFAASTLRLYLQRDNIGLLKIIIIKVNKNCGPEEDRGLCVM